MTDQLNGQEPRCWKRSPPGIQRVLCRVSIGAQCGPADIAVWPEQDGAVGNAFVAKQPRQFAPFDPDPLFAFAAL